jgi:GGDEF domain-containing protein
LFAATVGAAAASVLPAQPVAIVSSERSGAATAYRLHVTEQGRGFVVVVPYDARSASFEVNGVERERAGYNIPVGTAPFGHGMATFPLTNVRPTDRVVVRVFGSHEKLRFLDASGTTATAHAIGLLSGAYYAILGIVAFFIIAALCVARDPTMAWYLCYTVSLILIELTRDNVFPFAQATNAVWLLAAIALSTLAVVGFYVSYLRLRTEAPRLLYALGFWTVAPWILNAVFLAAAHRPLDGEALVPPMTVVLIACIAIAALRRRAGYKPAMYIAIGFLGLATALFSDVARTLMHAPSPFLDRWQIELGSTFDVLAFAVAVALRSRYSERQRASDLVTASFEAEHDDLTGLLNRRGLEGRFVGVEAFVSTVLFIDLDDFKEINDRGGHAAGDDALKIMARILRNAVRAEDIVARVGGRRIRGRANQLSRARGHRRRHRANFRRSFRRASARQKRPDAIRRFDRARRNRNGQTIFRSRRRSRRGRLSRQNRTPRPLPQTPPPRTLVSVHPATPHAPEHLKLRHRVTVVRVEPKRSPIVRDGLCFIALVHIRFPETIVSVGRFRIDLDIEFENTDGRPEFAGTNEIVAE